MNLYIKQRVIISQMKMPKMIRMHKRKRLPLLKKTRIMTMKKSLRKRVRKENLKKRVLKRSTMKTRRMKRKVKLRRKVKKKWKRREKRLNRKRNLVISPQMGLKSTNSRLAILRTPLAKSEGGSELLLLQLLKKLNLKSKNLLKPSPIKMMKVWRRKMRRKERVRWAMMKKMAKMKRWEKMKWKRQRKRVRTRLISLVRKVATGIRMRKVI